MEVLQLRSKGGEGSGHYDHKGIPGHHGGSLPDDETGSVNESSLTTVAQLLETSRSGWPKNGDTFSGEYMSIADAAREEKMNPLAGTIGTNLYLRDLGHSEEDWNAVRSLFNMHGYGGRSQEIADAKIAVLLEEDSSTGKLLRDISAAETYLLSEYGKVTDSSLYRKGDILQGKIECWTMNSGGARTQFIGGSSVLVPDKEMKISEMLKMGYTSIGGMGRMMGAPGEWEITMVSPSISKTKELKIIKLKGGEGSGHYDHAGIPGHHGGSLPDDEDKWLKGISYEPKASNVLQAIDHAKSHVNDLREDTRFYDKIDHKYDKVTDILSTLDKSISNATVKIRVKAHAVAQLLKDGRFKSQFETGVSSGMFCPEIRTDVEEWGLGVPTDIQNTARPIYGYLEGEGLSVSQYDLSNYGNVSIVLRDDVKERTTATLGDSLTGFHRHSTVGSPMLNFGIEGLNNKLDSLILATRDILPNPYRNNYSYTEAQIHGGVTLSDIDHVELRADDFGTTEEMIFLTDKFESHNIKVDILYGNDAKYKGGEGSGHFDHAGIPGHHGGSLPSDDTASASPYGHTAEQIVNVRKYTDNLISRLLTNDKYSKVMKKAMVELPKNVKNATVKIRVSTDVLPSILNEGRLKTQFETGTSNGILDTKFRSKIEKNGLGVPTDYDIKKRPIYGYLDGKGMGADDGNLDTYGTVVLCMKDSIKERTTATLGDSIGEFEYGSAIGSPVLNFGPEGMGIHALQNYLNSEYRVQPDVYSYTEAQIHGGVSVDDIDHVEFRTPTFELRGRKYPVSNYADTLAEYGLEILPLGSPNISKTKELKITKLKGGEGSGHFDHAGIPGHHGGSLPSDEKQWLKGISYRPSDEIMDEAMRISNRHIWMLRRETRFYHNVDNKYDKVGDALKELPGIISNGTVKIRIRGSAVEQLLKDGRFKTQFETGTSSGTFSPDLRRRSEENGLGVPKDFADTMRPVYGYLDGEGLPCQQFALENYGKVAIVLKDDIKERATVVLADSLGGFEAGRTVGSPVLNFGIEGLNNRLGEFIISSTNPETSVYIYTEVQIHGGVTLNDIDHVELNMEDFSGIEEPIMLTAKFDDYNIDVKVIYSTDADKKSIKLKGGEGSGHFDHAGIPGHHGGSLPRDGATYEPKGLPYKPDKNSIELARESANMHIDDISGNTTLKSHIKVTLSRLPMQISKATVKIRLHSQDLEALLESGRFKNQFETGNSSGEYDPDIRRRAEEDGLGVPASAPASMRPIYGYVEGDGVPISSGSLEWYGDTIAVLKDSVKSRTTVVLGDSLTGFEEGSAIGTPMLDFGIESINNRLSDYIWVEYLGRDDDNDSDETYPYTEAQIHGGVYLSDIDHIELSRYNHTFSDVPAEHYEEYYADMLSKYGIQLLPVDSPSISKTKELKIIKLKGGEGSGHYDHKGIPGHHGGSLPSDFSDETDLNKIDEFGLTLNSRQGLTDEEKKAVWSYVGVGYRDINTAFRNNQFPEGYAKEVQILDRLTSKRIGKDIIVYRALNRKNITGSTESIEPDSTGSSYTEKGYMSTSLFLDSSLDNKRDQFVIRMEMKTKDMGLYVGTNLAEVLLPRNTKITFGPKISANSNGVPVYEVSMKQADTNM